MHFDMFVHIVPVPDSPIF